MLKIFSEKLKYYSVKKARNNKGNKLGQYKHFPPANKEWFNSIYVYNNNTAIVLPCIDKSILKLIKSYFYLFSLKLEKKIKLKKKTITDRKLSVNKIIISKAELKHTNDKVIITVYIYNQQKKNYLNRINKIKTLNFFSKIYKSSKFSRAYFKLKMIRLKCFKISRKIIEKKKTLLNILRNRGKLYIFNYNINNYLDNYEKVYLNNYLKKYLYREMLYMYIKQNLFFNQSKFKHNYILPLTNLIKIYYNKNIEFNLVNLKYLYLNSYILTQSVVTKLRNRKNKLLKVLHKTLTMYQLPLINKIKPDNYIYNKKIRSQNPVVNNFIFPREYNNDGLNLILNAIYNKSLLLKKKLPKKNQTKYVTATVLNFIKYKFVTGIRLEAAGRLTKRYVAAKSISKKRYAGNLKNIDCSYKQLSSVVFRGYAKSNLQYTMLKSKTRIGSFGVKG